MRQLSQQQQANQKYLFKEEGTGGPPGYQPTATSQRVLPLNPRHSHLGGVRQSHSPKMMQPHMQGGGVANFSGMLQGNTSQSILSGKHAIASTMSVTGIGGLSQQVNLGPSPRPLGAGEQSSNQGYMEFMNLQHQHKAGGTAAGSGGGSLPGMQGQMPPTPGSVLSTRRDIKLPLSVMNRHSSQPRAMTKMKQGGIHSQVAMYSINPSTQGQHPNLNNHNPNQLMIPSNFGSQHQNNLEDFLCVNPLTNQQVTKLPSTQASSYYTRQGGATSSAGTASNSAGGPNVSGQSNFPGSGAIQMQSQAQQLYSPSTTIGTNSLDLPQHNIGHSQMASPIPHSLMNSAVGFLDPSDRSTTAGTTLPHLQTQKNSFHHRQRQTVSLNTTQQHPLQNVQLASQLDLNNIAPSNFAIQGGTSNNTSMIQFTGGMPTLAQVQTIGNLTQQNLKLRTIPRRTHKIANPQHQVQMNTNSSATDEETHNNHSRQQQKTILQVSGEKLSIGGHSNGGPKRSSPIDIRKSDTKLYHQISQTPSLHAYNSVMAIERLQHSALQPSHPHNGQQDDRSNSPILMPISLKQRLQNFLSGIPNVSEVSPLPSQGGKNLSQAFNSVHPSQFYSAVPISTSVPLVAHQIQNQSTDPQEVATIATPNIQNREIKIRKLNPSVGKNSMRFQAAQNAMNQPYSTQPGTIANPSPLTITSLNSNNMFSKGTLDHPGPSLQDLNTAKSALPKNESSPIGSVGKASGLSGIPQINQIESLSNIYSSIQSKQGAGVQDLTNLNSYQSTGNRPEISDFILSTQKKAKSSLNSDEKRRKFTTHTKFTSQKKGSFIGLQPSEMRQMTQQKQYPPNFSSIPNIVQANTTSQGSLSNTFAANPKNQNPQINNANKDIYIDNQGNQNDDTSQNTSTVLHLESYDILSSPEIMKGQNLQKLNDISYLDEQMVQGNFPEYVRGDSILQNIQKTQDDLEISGFSHEDFQLDNNGQMIGPQETQSPIKQVELDSSQEEYELLKQSPRGGGPNLAVIEEEFHDETNKSQQSRSRLRGHSVNSTLSSGTKTQVLNKNEETRKQLNNTQLNTSQDNGSPILSKFLTQRKNNEPFRKLFRQLWETGTNPTNKPSSEEVEKQIQDLAKLSLNTLSVEEIKGCIITMRKNQALRNRFQNPYIKRLRQRSIGTLSRSNDYLNFSILTPNHNGSSSSVIEENIIIANGNSGSMMSNSQSQVLQNAIHLGGGVGGGAGSLYAQALAYNQAKNNIHLLKQQERYTVGEQDLQQSSSGGDQSKQVKSSKIGDSGNSGSSGPSASIPRPISKKQQSFETPSLTSGKLPLSSNDMKRLQFSSQKHQSNKAKEIKNKTGGSGDNSSNSLVGNALNTSFNKVKSLQQQNSNDGTSSSHKSDPILNRLNKHSSGSDSYYIPQSGESFQYQSQQKNSIGKRQSKSLVRQLGSGVQGQNVNGAGSRDDQANFLMGVGGGSKIFNEVLNGQRAVFTNRVTAPVSEKIQGTLKKWREIKKLGQGTSGEVFLVQDIIKNAQPQYFVVKKLQIVSPNSGIDKEAIFKLRKEIEVYKKLGHENIVKFYGSEVVGTQFCIYLEYLAGGTIQSNYQAHPRQKLGEKQMKLYARQVTIGLAYLHENKVVHGDLKGANVLVDDTRKIVKLTDFGSAKLVESTVSQSDINCVIRGSLAWMAPEVLNNRGIRRKADVWSLGCLVIEMAVGGNPWGNELAMLDNNYQALMRIVDPTKSPPIPEDVSPECKDFISLCLTREYDKRPTAQELLQHPWLTAAAMDEKKNGISLQQIQEHIV